MRKRRYPWLEVPAPAIFRDWACRRGRDRYGSARRSRLRQTGKLLLSVEPMTGIEPRVFSLGSRFGTSVTVGVCPQKRHWVKWFDPQRGRNFEAWSVPPRLGATGNVAPSANPGRDVSGVPSWSDPVAASHRRMVKELVAQDGYAVDARAAEMS